MRRARSEAVGEARHPVSVLVVVYTTGADVLLLKRVTPFPFWQSVTGSLQRGETPADAARRELYEETGLCDEGGLVDTGHSRTFVIDPRWRHRFAAGVTENLEHEWRYRLDERVDIALHAREHSAWCWSPIDEAIGKVWSWTNREALVSLRETLE